MMSAEQYILLLQGNALPALSVCALFALGAWGVGGVILRRGDFIAFALGVFVFGTASLCLFPLPYSKISLQIAVSAVSVFALFGVYFAWKSFLAQKLLWCVCLLIFIFLVSSALLPPYAWDEQVYQIELLSRYMQNGSKQFIADNTYSAWPGFLQFFLLPGYAAGGLNFPRLFNALLSVVLGGTFFLALRPYGKLNAVCLTCAVMLSPLAFVLNRSVYAENTVALFGLAGFLALYRLRKNPVKSLILAGVFAGAAVSVKLTAAGGAAALAYLCLAGRSSRRYFLWFAAASALAALPFYLRIWYCTGNPVYPFCANIFGTSAAVESYHRMLGSSRYGMGALYGTVFGWLTTAFAGKIYDGVTAGFQLFALLALVFCGIHVNRGTLKMRIAGKGLTALLIMYLFWGLTAQQSRFLFPALFLLTGMGGFLMTSFKCRTQRIFCILTIAGIFLTAELYPHIRHCFAAGKILRTARREPLRFLSFAQRDNDYVKILEAIGRTPVKSRVLLLFEKRGLYIPRRHETGDPGFQEKYFTVLPDTAEKFLQEIQDFDYLLLGSGERNVDLQESELEIRQKLHSLTAAALGNGGLELVFSGKTCHLLKIKRLTKR